MFASQIAQAVCLLYIQGRWNMLEIGDSLYTIYSAEFLTAGF